jgi:hypothetical protein
MGLLERVSAYGMMAYVAALAVGLWRRTDKPEVTVERAREFSHVP